MTDETRGSLTDEELTKLREWAKSVLRELKGCGIRTWFALEDPRLTDPVTLEPPTDYLRILSVIEDRPYLRPFRMRLQVRRILDKPEAYRGHVCIEHRGWWADVHPDRG